MKTPFRFCLFLSICFFSSALSAQNWSWATRTPEMSDYIDVAVGPHGEAISIYEAYNNAWHLDVHDSSGALIREKEFYYLEPYGNCAFGVGTDATGNIYVVSRQSFEEPLERNEHALDPEGYDEEEDEERETTWHLYIVIEKFSPELELLGSLRVLQLTHFENYSIEVRDFVVDDAGNCWLGGFTDDNKFSYKEQVINPGPAGCHFVMKVGANMKEPAWINTFIGSGPAYVLSFHLAVNKKGICVMTGAYAKTMQVGKTILTSQPIKSLLESEMYITAFRADGTIAWVKSLLVPSYDTDVVALSGGDFVCAGAFSDATQLGSVKLPAGKKYGSFVMSIDAKSGKMGKVYVNDTSMIIGLEAGLNNDFYCLFDLSGSSHVHYVFHFDKKMKGERFSYVTVHNPVTASNGGAYYLAGTWSWISRLGDPPNAKYVKGDGPHDGADYGQGDSGGLVGRLELKTKGAK
ncbi:MAG TPA: hypothetical protein VK826_00495 [Bacteroidia bacterium]|nr:hypothetical protein [Bacteroidia bacterium]